MILKKFLLLEKNKKKIFFFPLQKINLSGLDFFYAVCNLSMYFKGIERNKKIAILYDNSIEYLIISFYVMLKNLTLVPINPVLSKSEILQIYKNSNSDIIISGKENFFKLKKIKKKIKFNFDVRITNKILKNYKNIFKIGKKKTIHFYYCIPQGQQDLPKEPC